jgi:hypothetical protein
LLVFSYQTRHVSAFFNSADEEYRVLLPWGCWEHLVFQQGQQDSQNCARTCCDLRQKATVVATSRRISWPFGQIMGYFSSCHRNAMETVPDGKPNIDGENAA